MGTHKSDETIERWRKSYEHDFSSALRETDEWYARYRRDFAPDRYGRVEFSASAPKKSVENRRETRLSDLVLVGRGKVTNEKCGKFRGYYGCIQHEKHEGGVMFGRPYFNSCDKPSCPECFYSWAQREGYSNIEPRLLAASELLGLPVDHIVASLPKDDYGLTYKEAKRKCIGILASCGVIGGVMIVHGNRMDKLTRVESFSPHFHVVGFVEGGYERCRRCTGGDCYACDGIEGRCYRAYRDTGYIVRVLDERRTVGGTAYYQLNHSSTDMSKRRFRIAVWFGRCGYRNLGVTSEKPRLKCPKCGGQCGSLEYVGSKHFVIDKKSSDFKKVLFEPYFENGSPAWVVAEAKSEGVDVD
jgi:hypothetical protein